MNSPNHTPIFHTSPYKQILRSSSDIQRLLKTRSHPISLEFRSDEANSINKSSFKKLMHSTSKRALKLKNPPVKEISNSGSLTRHLRRLQVHPEHAARYITEITHKFSKVTHFAIHDEQDAFVPIRIRKKVHPMRNLRSFVYDHEFCRDFLRCARYVTELKIRKASLDLVQLKRLQCLERFHLILKTRYLSLLEEDVKLASDLGQTLLRLPFVENIVLEQEVDPETNPYTFLELQKILKEKAKVHLVADFIDVSNQRNKNMSVEKILQAISDSGINSLKVNYVGVAQPMNRFGRSFYAPLHIKADLYAKFLSEIMGMLFKNVQFRPVVHSTYVDSGVKDRLIEGLASTTNLNIPKINFVYDLDMIEFNNLDLFYELYVQKGPSYDVKIVNKMDFRRGLFEKLEDHYSQVFAKVHEAKAPVSLQIITKNLSTLNSLIHLIAPLMGSILLKTLTVQVIEPVDNNNLKDLLKMMAGSDFCGTTKELELDFLQKGMPKQEEIFDLLLGILQASSKLSKMTLHYHNSRECEELIKGVFGQLRLQNTRTECEYEINVDRTIYE